MCKRSTYNANLPGIWEVFCEINSLVKRKSTGSRATPACLHNVDWELITKLSLWFVLWTLPAVKQVGLVTHTTECSFCSPSTETYLAPGDSTQWQPAESSSSPRQLLQAKSPAISGHLYYCSLQALISPCCSGKAKWETAMWKQTQKLKANLALKFTGLTLLLVRTSRQSLTAQEASSQKWWKQGMPQHLQRTKGGKTPLLQDQPRLFGVMLPLGPRAAKSATNSKRQHALWAPSLKEGNGRFSPISYWNRVESLQ